MLFGLPWTSQQCFSGELLPHCWTRQQWHPNCRNVVFSTGSCRAERETGFRNKHHGGLAGAVELRLVAGHNLDVRHLAHRWPHSLCPIAAAGLPVASRGCCRRRAARTSRTACTAVGGSAAGMRVESGGAKGAGGLRLPSAHGLFAGVVHRRLRLPRARGDARPRVGPSGGPRSRLAVGCRLLLCGVVVASDGVVVATSLARGLRSIGRRSQPIGSRRSRPTGGLLGSHGATACPAEATWLVVGRGFGFPIEPRPPRRTTLESFQALPTGTASRANRGGLDRSAGESCYRDDPVYRLGSTPGMSSRRRNDDERVDEFVAPLIGRGGLGGTGKPAFQRRGGW